MLWAVDGRQASRIVAFNEHAYPVQSVAFSPDGRAVASAAGNELFRWDASVPVLASTGLHDRSSPDRERRARQLPPRRPAATRQVPEGLRQSDLTSRTAFGSRPYGCQKEGLLGVVAAVLGRSRGRASVVLAGAGLP